MTCTVHAFILQQLLVRFVRNVLIYWKIIFDLWIYVFQIHRFDMMYVSLKNHHLQTPGLLSFFYFHTSAACVYFDPDTETIPPPFFTHVSFFTRSSFRGYLVTLIPFFCFLFSLYSPSPRSSPGKSVVSESEDEVQAAEVGGGGLRVAAEEEGIASHKPVETGD